MAKKQVPEKKQFNNPNVIGLRAEVLEQPITETLEQNYMPYAMSVIISRAIPEIDGFKPSQKAALYDVQNGPFKRRTNKKRKHCRPDNAP